VSGLYYALGDSMSIDEYAGGPGCGAASLLVRDLASAEPDWSLRLLAFDGATTEDVWQDQVPRVLERPALVTLTMGGNDLLAAAFGYEDAYQEHVADRVRANGELILGELRRLSGPDTPIVVTTVYDPSDGTGDASSAGMPPWPDGLYALAALNEELRRLADRHGAVVADVHGVFIGHGISAGDVTQPDPRPPNRELWYCGAIEPNAWGAEAIARTWRAALPD
jgi:lysophospholipase L1-like esterase